MCDRKGTAIDDGCEVTDLAGLPPRALHVLECAEADLRHSSGMPRLVAFQALATLASSPGAKPRVVEKADAARTSVALARRDCEAFFSTEVTRGQTVGDLFPAERDLVAETLARLEGADLGDVPAAVESVLGTLGAITASIQNARKSLREFFDGQVEQLGQLCDAQRVHLVTRFAPEDDVNLFMDAARVQLALTELLANALKHAFNRGEGTVRFEVESGESTNDVILAVADDGGGIPDDLRDRLFERGASTGGSGEGLALVREIIEDEHLGKLRYMTGHRGTRWEMVLPVRVSRERVKGSAPTVAVANADGEEPPADIRPALKMLGKRYILESRLGKGGFGEVWKAYDTELSLHVAVKVVHADRLGDPQFEESLKREAHAAIRLAHSNIVTVRNYEYVDGECFLIMDYVDGPNLAQVLADHPDGRLPEREVIRTAKDVCAALEHAHGKGVLHLDIKPANILREPSGVCRVADFGIARVIDACVTRITGELTSGTVAYMSPEALQGKRTDERSDLYSLGATLYELSSGRGPFVEGDIAYQQIHEAPPAPEGVSDALWDVVRTCLAKDPDRRPGSARELSERLDGVLEAAPEGGEAAAEKRRRAPAQARPGHRRALRAIACVAVIGLIAALIAAGVWKTLSMLPGRAPEGCAAVPGAGRDLGTGWSREVVHEATGMSFVLVPAGSFVMGADDEDAGEGPGHRVLITKPFYISKFEITQGQFREATGENPSRFEGEALPVERVSYVDCAVFCQKTGFRMPTEAEWEYAAQGAAASGDASDDRPVAASETGAAHRGVQGVLDNVAEWCSDWYALYNEGDAVDPTGPERGERRVIRGGSFLSDPSQLRRTMRSSLSPTDRRDFVGFRVAMDIVD